ncbi:MAG: hypothetical protein VYC34_01470 [Planctomycetota bacterium]|nr:hypothetical protein [Planctomycetota bacterium]
MSERRGDRPYSLPLGREAFRRALRVGHGRAMQHARQFGVEGVFDLVVELAFENEGYDGQTEASYADWLVDMLEMTGRVDGFLQEVERRFAAALEAGAEEASGAPTLEELAKRGHERARALLYSALAGYRSPESFWQSRALIELDGTDGLIAVASAMGRRLREDPSLTMEPIPLWLFESVFLGEAENDGRQILDEVRSSDSDVARYLDHLDAVEAAASERRSTEQSEEIPEWQGRGGDPDDWKRIVSSWSADELIAIIEQQGKAVSTGHLVAWARTASDEEKRTVLERALREDDPARLVRFLRVFLYEMLPFVDERVLALIDHSDGSVQHSAIWAMEHTPHPLIRRAALDRLQDARADPRLFGLFASGYEPADATLIEHALAKADWSDDQWVDGFAWSMRTIFDGRVAPEASAFMLHIYEHARHRTHREVAVECLLRWHTAPEWLLEEAADDASGDTRQTVRDHVAKRRKRRS